MLFGYPTTTVTHIETSTNNIDDNNEINMENDNSENNENHEVNFEEIEREAEAWNDEHRSDTSEESHEEESHEVETTVNERLTSVQRIIKEAVISTPVNRVFVSKVETN
eukprot:TRINITY_DN6521_c1_g1_i1.p2 TRINITY_DN6521_c1_g1~~TRINITY_DN6521_c1_g1_i1.p2  ORF type:complete len:109 (-),score=20.64 TRINITY_DN6521_c1_g1_i1:56-382(-)